MNKFNEILKKLKNQSKVENVVFYVNYSFLVIFCILVN